MQPETPQSNVPQNTGEQLDPSIVALTKAIGKAESGGNYDYAKIGPDGERGAYQMTPNFVKNYAPKYLGKYDPNNLSPAEQDKLAYGVVKDWGTTGDPAYSHLGKLSAAQVASAWNAGDPNAYLEPHEGTSHGGAHYNTNAYVEKVGNYFNELSGQSGAKPPTTPEMPNTGKGLSNPPLSVKIGLGTILLGSAALGLAPETGGISLAALPAIAGGAAASSLLKKGLQKGKDLAKGFLGYKGAEELGETAGLLKGNNPPQTESVTQDDSKIESDLARIEAELPQAHEHSNSIFQTQLEALMGFPTGKVMSSDSNVKQGMETNAMYGFLPQNNNGTMDATEALSESQKVVGELSDSVARSLDAEGTRGSFGEAIAHAKEDLKRANITASEREHAEKFIEDEAGAYVRQHGNTPTLGNIERIKKEVGMAVGKWDMTKPQAHKAALKSLYRGLRANIVSHTGNKELYNRVMKEEENLKKGQAVLKLLHKKKALSNTSAIKDLMKIGGRYASLAIGDKIGGPIGAIVGQMLGDKVITAVEKKYGQSILDRPSTQKMVEELKSKKPAIFHFLQKEMKKKGFMLALPAPSGKKLGVEGSDIQLSEQSESKRDEAHVKKFGKSYEKTRTLELPAPKQGASRSGKTIPGILRLRASGEKDFKAPGTNRKGLARRLKAKKTIEKANENIYKKDSELPVIEANIPELNKSKLRKTKQV